MPEYGKVYHKFWNNEKVKELMAKNEPSVWLFLYLMTTRHSNLIGLYMIANPFIKVDLPSWSLKKIETALTFLENHNFIKREQANCLLLVPSWFEHNPLTSDNQQKKALAQLSELPKTSKLLPLLKKAIFKLDEDEHRLAYGIANAVPDGVPNAVANAVPNSEAVTETEEEAVTETVCMPFEEIISHLNKLTGKRYSHKSEHSRKFIRARFKEDFTLEDFFYVNQVKAEEWLASDQEKYLRPETLYGNKFEGYLNQRFVKRSLPELELKNALAGLEFINDGEYKVDGLGQGKISRLSAKISGGVQQVPE